MNRDRGIVRSAAAAALGIGAILGVAGCASPPPAADHTAHITLPPTAGAADYQLGGAYQPPAGVTVVTRDSTSHPAPGVYSICYVNGFQTQPGTEWPSDLILHTSSGEPLVDPGWPGEHLIDISTAAKRIAAAARIAKSTDRCAQKGFTAVEFDNLDSYTRSKKQLTITDTIAFATLLVDRAHHDSLAAGQKNTTQLASRGKTDIGYDFAVSEECTAYDECSAYTKVYGTHVIDIEYTDDLRGSFASVCARPSTPALTILRDRELVTPASTAYVYRRC